MEMWDIYDKDKKRTGKLMKRNDWNMKPGEFHLTVIGIVQDLEGRFLVTRRNLDKEWAAGWWELPGGGVNAGEDSKDAIIREIKEEVGIDVSNAKGGHIYTYKNESPEEKNNYFVDVYNFVLDFKASDIKVQEEEVLEFNIATFEEIQNYEKEPRCGVCLGAVSLPVSCRLLRRHLHHSGSRGDHSCRNCPRRNHSR